MGRDQFVMVMYAMKRLLQSPEMWAFVVIPVWLTGLVITALTASISSYREVAVLISAWWAVAFWTSGAAQWLWLPPDRWRVGNPWFELGRGTWALGLSLLVIHVFVTFALQHGWSHAAAFEHTQQVSGVGEGIYVNYLVLFVWAIDVFWVLFHPASYVRRPRWLGWGIHGFLAFIVFNSTVIYGTGLLRWGGAIWFALLALYWARRASFHLPTS